MKQRRNSAAGFTLVELSIVLVIIGLIIGGVLSGRQIMKNAQITNAVNSIQAYQAQFQTYVQNYSVMPGDDVNATGRFTNSSVANIKNGDGSGILEGTFNSTLATDDTYLVWIHLRAAGLVKNQAMNASSTISQPANPYGGIYGFQNGAFGITTNVLCLNNVPGDAAEAIDSRLDDGASGTGSIQAIAETPSSTTASKATSGATPDTAYSFGNTYTMCVGM